MKEKVFILGGSGMLGQELVSLFRSIPKYEVIAPSHKEVDVTNTESLKDMLHELRPRYIINAATYNAVDLCEDSDEEYEKALILNRDVPRELAEISRNTSSTFVHYSTDYVFGDNEVLPGGLREDTIPRPNSRYGVSKYLGEQAALESGECVYVIRLSRLFGKPAQHSGKKSFFDTMLALSETKKELQAVEDEVSCFTYAPDLALATTELISDRAPYGIYHLVNDGAVSWWDALVTLFRCMGRDVVVHKVRGSMFTRKAKRPAYSALASTKRPPLRSLHEALREYATTLENVSKRI